MATPVTVLVSVVENVRLHPNADRLAICDVLGWQMVVPRGIYADGDKVVYFPPDTLIPAEWADLWGIRTYLKGKRNDRVGRVNLRGEPSFGLAVRPPEEQDWPVGTNVAEFFGATKFEPPIRLSVGDAAPSHPLFHKYTDMENLRNYPQALEKGEEVVCTEKIHGTNCRVGLVEGEEMAGSMELRRARRDEDKLATNTYWFPWTLAGVSDLIHALADRKHAAQIILFGEVYGGSIQSLHYGVPKGGGLGFRAFDILVGGDYLTYDEFAACCGEFGVETAPLLYRGPFSLANVRVASAGATDLDDTHMREGTVVRPVRERTHPDVGRLILKYLSDEYLLSKHSDFKDV